MEVGRKKKVAKGRGGRVGEGRGKILVEYHRWNVGGKGEEGSCSFLSLTNLIYSHLIKLSYYFHEYL